MIVLVLALIILGPKRLPDAARPLGRGMRESNDSLSLSNADTRERSLASRVPAGAESPPTDAGQPQIGRHASPSASAAARPTDFAACRHSALTGKTASAVNMMGRPAAATVNVPRTCGDTRCGWPRCGFTGTGRQGPASAASRRCELLLRTVSEPTKRLALPGDEPQPPAPIAALSGRRPVKIL